MGVAQYDVNSDMIVGVEPGYEKDGNFSYSVLKVDPVTLEVKDRLPADKEWVCVSLFFHFFVCFFNKKKNETTIVLIQPC